MKIQNVKFPDTPEATLDKVKELRPFIDRFYEETGEGNTADLAPEMLTILWHNGALDFIEALDGEKRVGLMMLSIYDNHVTQRRVASITTAYVEQSYRQQGIFNAMFNHAKVVCQARRINALETMVKNDGVPIKVGKPFAQVFRLEI